MDIRTHSTSWELDEQTFRDGVQLLAMGHCAEAQRLLEVVLHDRRGTLGHNHPDTVDSMVFLAAALAGQKRLGSARALLEPALKMLRVLPGPRHWKTQSVMCDLASIYWQQGESARAKRLVAELVTHSPALSDGLLDSHIGEQMQVLAERSREAGDIDDTRTLLTAAARVGAQTGNRLCRLWALLRLAELLITMAELNEAHDLIREVIVTGRDVPGWENFDVFTVATMLLDAMARSDEPQRWDRFTALNEELDELWSSHRET